jgi:hypothetical protein
MDHRSDFQRRIGRVAHLTRVQRPGVGPSKSLRMERSERINLMLARQDAFSKGQEFHGLDMDKPAPWTPILAVILAVAMGALAAMVARFVHFQLTGAIGFNMSADMDFALDVLMAVAIAFLLRELVSLCAVRQMGAQFAGILLALITMHNVVHEIPGPFIRLFSPEWVQHVKETTEPGTLVFRGQVIHI